MKLFLFILFILFNLKFNYVYSALGCMDNSYHGACGARDFKEYHYVGCACACKNIIDNRGLCLDCDHFGNPNRGDFNSAGCLDFAYF